MKIPGWVVKNMIFFAGLFCGIVFTLVSTILYLRNNLIVEMPSRYTYEESIAKLPEAAAYRNSSWNLRQVQCGLPPGKLSVYELCKSSYARQILTADPRFGVLLPCQIAIYERKDGKVMIASWNQTLLTGLLGGIPANIFAGKVIPEQRVIFHQLLNTKEKK